MRPFDIASQVSGKRSRHAREAGIALERSRDGASGTFLLGQGEELRTVMELLGHSMIWLTADTYGHVLPARAREATGAIDRLLGEGR
jgi:integrase